MKKKIAKSISDIDLPIEEIDREKEREDNFFVLPWKQAEFNPSLIKKGTEIHLSPIPNDSTPSFIYEALKENGSIIDIRILTTNSKSFAFVRFDDHKAVDRLINQRSIILKNTKANIHISKEQLTIFISNIKRTWTKEHFSKIINSKVSFISSIRFLKDPMKPECNRGFAFIEFDNPFYARKAYDLLSNDIILDGVAVTVDWGKGLDSSSDVSKTQLHVSGIRDSNTTEQLYEVFKSYGRIVQLKLSRDSENTQRTDYGFITYSSPNEAQEALEQFNWKDHFDNEITVQFAKKISSLISHRRQVEGNLLEKKRIRDNQEQWLNDKDELKQTTKPKLEQMQSLVSDKNRPPSITPLQTELAIADFLSK